MGNWRLEDKSIGRAFSNQFLQFETIDPVFFPNLRDERELVLVSDYAGEHQESQFIVLSYILTTKKSIFTTWESKRVRVRQQHLRDGRKMEFKSLSDRLRQKALVPFLDSCSVINGIIFLVAIDKALPSRVLGYAPGCIQSHSQPPLSWNPKSLEKLYLVSLFGSILVGGLCGEGQELLWITDDDEIVPNEKYLPDSGGCMAGLLQHVCGSTIELTLGIAGKFDDDKRAEDLVSIVDLAGGAFAEDIGAMGADGIPRSSSVSVATRKRLSTKASLIKGWLCALRGPLKKAACLVRQHSETEALFSFPSIEPLADLSGIVPQLWLPPDKRWLESSKAWRRRRPDVGE